MKKLLCALALLCAAGCSKTQHPSVGSSIYQGAITSINGSTVPAGGSLTTGNTLGVTGAAALGYSALNLAGGAGYITNALPLANLTQGTADQLLGENHGATTPAYFTASGDVGLTSGSFTVNKVSGSSPLAWTPNNQQWVIGATPVISQVTQTVGAGANMLIHAQDTSAGAAKGGSLILQYGNGAAAGAYVQVQDTSGSLMQFGVLAGQEATDSYGAIYGGQVTPSGSNYLEYWTTNDTTLGLNGGTDLYLDVAGGTYLHMGSSEVAAAQPVGGVSGTNAFAWYSCTVALTSGATNTLTSSQYFCPHLKFTGTLTGAGTIVVYPATDGACWDNDFSAIVTIADVISLKANSVTWGTTVAATASEFPHVCYSAGAARLVGNLMTE